MKEYDHKKIEKKWQNIWEKKGIYHAKNDPKKPKYYSLIEFPYPSGSGLHVGHIRSNTAMDIISRKRRMEGFNVLYPIGWDAFGLPTENYAISTGIHPIKVTKDNTNTFRKQLQALGFSFDWSREINTTDPKYYKWTQWIFLQFFKKGLAYKTRTLINWCPSCKIGLANEEVVGGMCERCGGQTEKRQKEQWMLAITKYADRLDKDLDTVDYLSKIKIQQRNWIGRSEGSEIEFKIQLPDNLTPALSQGEGRGEVVKVFTTRADTIFGVTYLVLAPEHPLVKKITTKEQKSYVNDYVTQSKNKTEVDRTNTEKEKTGVFTGAYAINPANEEKIPIWIADYVLANYGTGAIMAVPAHDERDFGFAKKYNLPVKQVVAPVFYGVRDDDRPRPDMSFVDRPAITAIVKHWAEDKFLILDWKKVSWHTFITGGIEEGQTAEEAARREIFEETGYRNLELIKRLIPYHSRFYHTPKARNTFAHFETFYFGLTDGQQASLSEDEKEKHQLRWVPREEVIGQLTPDGQQTIFQYFLKPGAILESGLLINSGRFDGLDSEKAKKEITKFVGGKEKIIYKLRDWVFSRQRYWGEPIPLIHCENCGVIPVPEKDLPIELPRVKNYQPTDSGESPLANISKWVNVECPKCKGPAKRETDTMPNWAGSSWYYLRYADPKNKKEFASGKNLKYWMPVDWYNGGNEHTTLHLLYSRFWHKFLYDLKLVPTSEPYMKRTSHGMILASGGDKMSKSKGNVVNPDDLIKTYGADTLRIYEMFMGPFDQSVSWSTDSLIGPRRFLEKVWRIGQKVSENQNDFSGPRVARADIINKSGLNQTIQNPSDFLSLKKLLHKTIKKVSEDIEGMNFNTAISSMMILSTEIERALHTSVKDFKMFLQILSPFAPHITEELWNMLGEKKTINFSDWPKWDKNLVKDEEIKIAVQINGKLRAEMMIQAGDDEEYIKEKVLKNEVVVRHIAGKNLTRVIYVKNRLINIVL